MVDLNAAVVVVAVVVVGTADVAVDVAVVT